MKNVKVFQLECEDASGLGGPMGTETTSTIFTKLFSSREKAHAYAEKDAKKRNAGWDGKPFPPLKEWNKHSTGEVGIDMRSVLYSIKPMTIS